jgi:ribosomal protein S24E
MNITKELEAPLLARKRVTLEVEKRGVTPSRKELVKEVAAKVGSKPELIVIKHIYTQYGSQDIKVIAHVYKKREDLERVEEEYLVKKNVVEEPEAKPEQAQSSSSEAETKEETKEE